jgi:hypothetical protein
MMGRRERGQGQLFYAFDLDKAVPADHLVRQIDGVLDLDWVHRELAPYYSRHAFTVNRSEGYASIASYSANRAHRISCAGRRAAPPIRSNLSRRDTQLRLCRKLLNHNSVSALKTHKNSLLLANTGLKRAFEFRSMV